MEYGLVLLWLAVYLWTLLAGVPLAALLFPRFADRGAGLALPLAVATVGIVAYWVGQIAFGWPALIAGAVVLLAGSGVALLRGVDVDPRGYVSAALVFTVAYLFLIAVRAVDPAAWAGGGEKFLDFGLLASLLRASHLPPEDVWFAGERVQYYYGGHMLASLFARLTGTEARYAYNLALAGFYATFVTAAYGLAGAVAADRGRSFRAAGLAAGFFVALASNLAPPIRLLGWLLPWGGGARLLELASLKAESLALGPGNFDYWSASRVIEGAINEFPFFAFLNGDLHAHMMSPPLLLLAAGLLFSYWQTPAERLTRRRLLVASVAPLAGLVAVVNTWSVPSVLGLCWLSLLLAAAPPWTLLPRAVERRVAARAAGGRLADELWRAGTALAVVAVVGAFGVLAAIPFFTGTASGRAIAFLPEPRSDLPGLLVVHGAFLLVAAAYFRERLDLFPGNLRYALYALVAAAFVTWLYQATVFALFLPLLLAAWFALRYTDRTGYESVLLVGLAGLVVLVELAYVREEAGPGRMNTVFKVYAQVWALWAPVAGVMLADVVDFPRAAADLRADLGDVARGFGGSTGGETARAEVVGPRTAGTGGETFSSRLVRRENRRALLSALLVLSLSVYGAFALGGHFTNEGLSPSLDDPTLDAREYVPERHPGEAAAIEWLATEVEGQPNMVSAPGSRGIYQWVNAPSSLSGVPTVAGWSHEVGYRGRAAYDARVADVETILTTDDAARRADLLREYEVKYVYVGPIERDRYGEPAFGDEPGISVAKRLGDVTIYEVDRSELTE